MRILVYGAGAVGLYMSTRLAQSGHEVTLKARGATLTEEGPLTVLSGEEVETTDSVTVVGEASGEFDLIILTTKAWQVGEAAAEVGGLLAPGGLLMTTQNGVDAPAKAAEHVPAEQVLAGSTVVIAERTAPRTVELGMGEGAFMVGSTLRSEPTDADTEVVAALVGARMLTRWSEDITTVLWKKLSLVSSYGGVGALTGTTAGVMRAVPQTRALVLNAMREVFNVGNARGASLTEKDFEEVSGRFLKKFPEDTTASMQRDLLAGRPSELADQIGAVVVHAREAGLEAPIYETIYASQLPRELMARRES